MIVEEPALAYSKQYMTIEEYLEMENASEEKHEYYKGEIFAMAGATMPHNHVSTNILVALHGKLKGKSCKPFGSDTRVHVNKNTLFTYPDITVICGEPETLNNDNMTILNPAMIIEVLSPSTADYNKGQKFMLYRDIPTLKEYVMADPEAKTVECWFINSTGFWQQRIYTLADTNAYFHSLQIGLSMDDIFEGVK